MSRATPKKMPAPPPGQLFADPKPRDVPDKTAAMLGLLAALGCRRDVVGALLDMAQPDQPLDDKRYLRGPIVVHSGGGWYQDLPDWLAPQIGAERVEIVAGKAPKGMIVGPTEITAVMYSATMDAPLRHELCELYFWASTNANARHRKVPVADMWKAIGHPPIADADMLARREYRDLAYDVRRKVAAAQQARERGEKQPVKMPAVPVIIHEQMELLT